MLKYSNIKKNFDQLINKNELKMIFLKRFTIVIPFTSINYIITFTNILNDLIVFTFSNIKSSTITAILNINRSSHTKISIVSIKIIIISFTSITIVTIKS